MPPVPRRTEATRGPCPRASLAPHFGIARTRLTALRFASIALLALAACGDGEEGPVRISPDVGVDVGPGLCGNGVRERAEECDGLDLGRRSCLQLGFTGGQLACRPDCTFDPTDCRRPAVCGNGILQPPEECDDSNLDGGDGCSPVCRIEFCGDGIVQEDPRRPEACEPGQVRLVDCPFLPGRPSFEVGCSPACRWDTFRCPAPETCGDGRIDHGEACDDGNDNDFDDCNGTCVSRRCGDGRLDPGQACEGTDFGALDCTTFGFAGGTLLCSQDCRVSTRDCEGSGDAPDDGSGGDSDGGSGDRG